MVKDDKQPVLLDLGRSEIGLPEEILEAIVLLLDVLPGAAKCFILGMHWLARLLKTIWQAHWHV